MYLHKPVVDYRQLRLNKLNTPQYRHLLLLLYWPVYGLLFLYVERFRVVENWHAVHCALDDAIPFCEAFLIPYMFWFIALVGMSLYTLLYDTEIFRRFQKFIILTYSIAMLTYLLWPTCQQLRPETFARDNVLTRFIRGFYQFDTNTNVCPSVHVIGAMAVQFAASDLLRHKEAGWHIISWVVTLSICLSTVFLKQHSILDVAAALPVCALGYACCFVSNRPFAAKNVRNVFRSESPLKHILCLVLGIVFLVVGIIGLLIPVVPQVPFLTASLLFFAACIPGLRKRLFSIKVFREHLLPHIQKNRHLRKLLLKEEDQLRESSL